MVDNLFLEKMEEYVKYYPEFKNFKEAIDEVGKVMDIFHLRVLDIASDKDPVFSSIMARIFTESQFVHFKDDEVRSKKVKAKYSKISNLDIAYSIKDLNPPYDIAVAFFTLHELRNPTKSIRKSLNLLEENGKIVIFDYDLRWFSEMAKRERWDKDKTHEMFKHIFPSGNEKKVLNEEEDCIENHTRWSIEDYIGKGEQNLESSYFRKKVCLRDLVSKSYRIDTPWGKKPKTRLYIGEKI
jgi:hypothetical protein